MIWFDTPDNTVTTIDTLYKYSKEQNITLFPTEDYDFWQPYEANYQKFDRYFYQKYRAFKVIQEYPKGTSESDMLADWKQIIDAHLFINQKRYSELYRVQVLAADAYDIVNNYDLREEAERTNTGTQTDAMGARIDSTEKGAGSTSTQYGNTSESLQYGNTSESTQYGARSDQNIYGSRTDSNETTLGQQTSDNEQTRSAFNATELQPVAGGSITNGSRQDSATLTTGSHTDTANLGAHTDTKTGQSHTDTKTSQTHTDTTTEAARTTTTNTGAQSNTRTDNLKEESTLHRYGNIGIQTAAEIIGGHERLWEAFKFYQMIFAEIAEEYLVIDVDFDFGGSTTSGGGGGGGGDAELLAAIRALSAQLTAAQTSINNNVDSAEGSIKSDIATDTAAIKSDIAALSTKTSGDTTAIRSDIASSTSNIRGDIVEVSTDGY